MTTPTVTVNREDVAKVYPGPILLLAGPGTGKTHTLARRVKFLIEEKNIGPNQIAIITFTNEAAVNMKDRIRDMEKPDVYLPPEKHPHLICTMHKLGQLIISKNSSKVPLEENFRVVTSADLKKTLLEDSAQLVNLLRQEAISTEDCRQKGKCEESQKEAKCQICNKYKELLRSNNAIDHDDQIMLACALLKNNPDVLKEYREKMRYLLVDEYQDINRAQFELIKLLADKQEDGLFCVGDDDQSIYSFRGGSPEYIKNFEKDFLNGKVKSIAVCRRTPPEIYNGALKIIEKFNKNRRPKPISEFVNKQGEVFFYDVPSQYKEAQMIVRIVKEAVPSKDVLILVPHQGFAGPIKNALRQARINYQSKIDVDNFRINLLDTLKDWIDNPTDNFALRQCMQEIINSGNFNIPSEKVRSNGKKQERENILKEISLCWATVLSKKQPLFDALKELAKKNTTIKDVMNALENISRAVKDNTGDFAKLSIDLLRPWANPNGLLLEISKLLEEITSQNIAGSVNVRILSMQRAKGLEAEIVIIVGLDKDVFPRKGTSDYGTEEISRLLYVSMTRAEEELHLFHSRTRDAAITFLTNPPGQGYNLLGISPLLEDVLDNGVMKKYIKAESVKKKTVKSKI